MCSSNRNFNNILVFIFMYMIFQYKRYTYKDIFAIYRMFSECMIFSNQRSCVIFIQKPTIYDFQTLWKEHRIDKKSILFRFDLNLKSKFPALIIVLVELSMNPTRVTVSVDALHNPSSPPPPLQIAAELPVLLLCMGVLFGCTTTIDRCVGTGYGCAARLPCVMEWCARA